MKDVLIIRLNVLADRKAMYDLYKSIMDQKDKGAIVLPFWCDCGLVNVPDDIEIKIEECERNDDKESLPGS